MHFELVDSGISLVLEDEALSKVVCRGPSGVWVVVKVQTCTSIDN